MEQGLDHLNWSLVQAFLAVAETGSLSAASRKIGQSQPTLGRQIKAIEHGLGISLFDRQPRGFVLNKAGVRLLAHAQNMRQAAAQLSLAAAGQVQTLNGVVRIAASVIFSHYHMPKIIAKIRKAEPDIEIELAPSDTSDNLLFREADIAVRMYQPTQNDVIAKKLGEFTTGLFAHRDYLQQNGTPTGPLDLGKHDFVGFDSSTLIIDGMRAVGVQVDRHRFTVRCDQQAIYWELVCAGCGIGVAQSVIGQNDPEMVQVLPDIPIDNIPVWLVAHQALRNTARIRRVFDILAESIAKLTDA